MSNNVDIRELNERIERESSFVELINSEMSNVIVGQKQMVEKLMIGLLANGHILLEGAPGLAKTLAIKSLANIIQAKFSRIQFTPDLLPADVIGTMIYSQKKEEFVLFLQCLFALFLPFHSLFAPPRKRKYHAADVLLSVLCPFLSG